MAGRALGRRRPAGSGGTLVLDTAGLRGLALGDALARGVLEAAVERGAGVAISAATLVEVRRGDAAVDRVLERVTVVPVTEAIGRAAGALACGPVRALDALVAATALASPRPVLLLTGRPDDFQPLVDEPGRAKTERVGVAPV